MTPLQIKMMLHYYAIAEPYSARDLCHANSSAVHEQREFLVNCGMLRINDSSDSGYEVTDKGQFYIEYLLSVPVPSTKFVIEIAPF